MNTLLTPSKGSPLHRQLAPHSLHSTFCTHSPEQSREYNEWARQKCLLPLVVSQGVKFRDVREASDTPKEGAWGASSSRKFHQSYLGNGGCERSRADTLLIPTQKLPGRSWVSGSCTLVLAVASRLASGTHMHTFQQPQPLGCVSCGLCTWIIGSKEESWTPCGSMLKTKLVKAIHCLFPFKIQVLFKNLKLPNGCNFLVLIYHNGTVNKWKKIKLGSKTILYSHLIILDEPFII